MTDVNQLPKIPWWVSYWTDPTTTRSSLRQQGWIFFLMATAAVGIGIVYVLWRPPAMGHVVLPVAFGLMPVGAIGAGIWVLAAARWIDRHQAWDHLATKQEREEHQANQTLWKRSLPLGLLVMAVGAAVGGVLGWVWEAEVGIILGVVLGVVSGFVLGVTLAGFREGIRSNVGKPVDVVPQDAERRAPAGGGRDAV